MAELTVHETMQLAIRLHQAGKLHDAELIYRQVLAAFPDHPDALHLLGVIAHQTGNLDAAVDLMGRAIQIHPNAPEYHLSLGNVLAAKGLFQPASASYATAIRLRPNFAEAHSNLADVFQKLGFPDDAIHSARQAIQLNPQLAQAHFNLGNALRAKGANPDAIAAFRQAIQLKPDHFEAHNNLGNALHDSGQLEEALASLANAERLKPSSAEILNNLGNVLCDLGRVEDAIAAYHKSIRINPEFPEAHYDLGFALLLKGDFARGCPEYEWRWRCNKQSSPNRHFAQPIWNGEPLEGRTILIHSDAGIGDTIQFIRYAPLIAARGGKVIIECQPPLARLLENFAGAEHVVAMNQPLPHFDLHCPMLSLPHAMRTTLETIPAAVPYLRAPKKEFDRVAPNSALKVGLVWMANPKFPENCWRSITLSHFAALARIPNIEFYSLQKGEASREAAHPPDGMHLIDLTADLTDFADTAALISALDLVITVDTSVAHLAGALAKPVWVLLPHAPDWRWLQDRQDSPWYPTMRLYRQPTPANWQPPLTQIAHDLAAHPHPSSF